MSDEGEVMLSDVPLRSHAIGYTLCGRELKLRVGGEGSSGKCRCCQPDSGNPAVRDEREACGNLGYGGNFLPKVARAVFLPDHHTNGILTKGGDVEMA